MATSQLIVPGNASPSQVLSGQTFSAGTNYNTSGSMPNNGAVSITPGTTSKPIPAGYHNGNGTVAGDANLVASNILSGVSVFGVTGNVIAGKRFASGNLTVNLTANFGTVDVTGLGFIPTTVFIAFGSNQQSASYLTPDTNQWIWSGYNANANTIAVVTQPTTNGFTIRSEYSSNYNGMLYWKAIE